MADNRPIGIFDSGLGGLTVVREIIKILPHENLIYLGDTARVPYGTRGEKTIKKFSQECIQFLLGKNVKCIVIACNTSSAVAGDFLKNKFSKVPIFDVVSPALRSLGNRNKKIGVIGTRGTIESGAYHVSFSKACPLLVPFIEEGEIKNEAMKIVLKNYLKPLKGKIGVLILGCTHYPIIKSMVRKELGREVRLLNPGESVARQLKGYLAKNKMLSLKKKKGAVEYYVTDLTDRFIDVAEMFLGERVAGKIKKVSL